MIIGSCCYCLATDWNQTGFSFTPAQRKYRPNATGIVALECAKGRGVILPGGKFELGVDESYGRTAEREFEEETGADFKVKSFIWSGMSTDKAYGYCFEMNNIDSTKIALGDDLGSGRIVLAQWNDLFRGQFGPYNRMVYHALLERRKRVR